MNVNGTDGATGATGATGARGASGRQGRDGRSSRVALLAGVLVVLIAFSATTFYYGQHTNRQVDSIAADAAYARCTAGVKLIKRFNKTYGVALETFLRDAAEARRVEARLVTPPAELRRSNLAVAARYKVLYDRLDPFPLPRCER